MNNTTLPAESVKPPLHLFSHAHLHAWAESLDIPDSTRPTLTALIGRTQPALAPWRADSPGPRCSPGIPELVADTGLKAHQISKHIKALLDAGIISRRPQWVRSPVGWPVGPMLTTTETTINIGGGHD